ncbi:MAG: cyclohexadienyl dehydratase [Halioglobus sp.]|jgi:cyclohexadienyl dehydratase
MFVLMILGSGSASASAKDLTQLVAERLSHMKSVAAYKWQHDLPIENVEREKQVLSSVSLLSLQHGLIAQTAESFFRSQIEAAKEIQRYWFAQWKRNPKLVPSESGDLDADIRPMLIALGAEITASLGRQTQTITLLQVEGLSGSTSAQLSDAARLVRRYPNRLKQVLDSGVLRVGTTGDYLPFSSGTRYQYEGIDIDLARDLAQSLGVKIQWVETSWPGLMQDLDLGLYDIGMSGISINLKRQRSAFFSSAYHRGGKTPIVRCQDTALYGSLAAIDQPGIRAVVNPGGTNERFARTHLKQATLRLHPDNRTVFEEILSHRADVMFTDQIEVQRQSQMSNELCAAMPGQTLSVSQKGFLLPQDMIWKQYVDTWLKQRVLEGRVREIFAEHMQR